MKMNAAWFLYQGLSVGLTKAETFTSKPGEIMDLMACNAIAHGAKQKIQLSFDEAIKMR